MSVKALASSTDECTRAQRVIYGGKVFPEVACVDCLGQMDFGRELVVAGNAPTEPEKLRSLLELCTKYMERRGAKLVLCLATNTAPMEEHAGWQTGSHEMPWSSFTCMEKACFLTMYSRSGNGADMASELASAAMTWLACAKLKGRRQLIAEPMLHAPKPAADEELTVRTRAVLAVHEAAGKLKAHVNGEIWYMDAGRKSSKVSKCMPDPTSKSVILSVNAEGSVGRISVGAALGYDMGAVNLSLLPSAQKHAMLCKSLPPAVCAAMLNAAVKFL